MPEVNSHQDLYIHCSMNKFYVLYTSSMKFSKETEKKSKLPNLLHCKTGILLPHINWHARESFQKCEGSLFWQHFDQTAEVVDCVVLEKNLGSHTWYLFPVSLESWVF